ncbi:MAG: hypothetical protein ACLPN2_00830 [Terriglobales bacterium]
MSVASPTIEGFRVAFRRPSLTLAEIAWRWAPGFTAVALLLFYFFEYFNTLPVTHADLVLLSTRQPALIARAIGHIFRGSLNRAVLAALVLAVGLSLLWSIAASLGRLATVDALLAYFRSATADNLSSRTDSLRERRPIRALFQLNFLRVALVLAMLLSVGGAAILSSFVSTNVHPRPGLAFALFVLLTGCICIAGWALNWWLSLAAVFVVRDGEDALGAFSRAVSFFRDRTGAVIAVSTWTGLAHCVAFSIPTTAASVPLAFIQVAPWRLVIASIALVTLAYFAVVDWLYMARLAGYVCLTEMPDTLPALPLPPPTLPSSKPSETAIDRDEPILSDLPNLAVQP